MIELALRKLRAWRYQRRFGSNLALYEREKALKPIGMLESPSGAEPVVDVVIPAIDKDLETLPLTVQGLRANLAHPLANIYVVAPANAAFVEFCREHDCRFLDEASIDVRKPWEFSYSPAGLDRRGWIFQQFIKLSGQVGTEEWFVVCDADTVLLRPHTFASNGRPVFYVSPTWTAAYEESYRKLFGRRIQRRLSFVHHCMAYRKSRLAQMRLEIESRCGCAWDAAILDRLDHDEISSVAEQQLYGNWIASREEVETLPARNLEVPRSHLAEYATLVERHAGNYKSITFHAWMKG
jgi:hypothetical protein